MIKYFPTVAFVHSVDAISLNKINMMMSNNLSRCEEDDRGKFHRFSVAKRGRTATLTNE